jgi:hypothetical protein
MIKPEEFVQAISERELDPHRPFAAYDPLRSGDQIATPLQQVTAFGSGFLIGTLVFVALIFLAALFTGAVAVAPPSNNSVFTELLYFVFGPPALATAAFTVGLLSSKSKATRPFSFKVGFLYALCGLPMMWLLLPSLWLASPALYLIACGLSPLMFDTTTKG